MDTTYLAPPSVLSLKTDEDDTLEKEAAAILAKSREGITALSDKRDFLTRDQLRLRAKKEITNQNGVSDESLMSGLFKRKYNPLAHSRPTRRAHSHED